MRFVGSLESSVATFSDDSKAGGRSFIGDWQNSGFGEDSKGGWAGDEINVEAKDGPITFKSLDDEPIPSSSAPNTQGGFLRRLFA